MVHMAECGLRMCGRRSWRHSCLDHGRPDNRFKTVRVFGSRAEVFDFLADFSTTEQWDPGVRIAQRNETGALEVGHSFSLVTLWKSHPSTMTYTLERLEKPKKIVLRGEGELIKALDTIELTQLSENETQVSYCLELVFRGPLRPFMFLIQTDLDNLGEDAMAGLVRSCAEKFGSNRAGFLR